MQASTFDCVAVPNYPDKPRNSGITMVVDVGLGLASQKDLLDTSNWFLDLGKIATGVSRILPTQLLTEKIRLYKENSVHAFPGGQFFELAFVQGRVEPYFEAVREAGYTHVEISDNCIELSSEAKSGCIRKAVGAGLTVLGEVGKKVEASSIDALIRDVEVSLEAGAWKVFVEAKELMDRGLNVQLMKSLAKAVDPSSLIFETPGQWIEGVSFHTQFQLWKWLLANFGPEVNIANVPPEHMVRLICARLGLGADTTFEKGAFVMSARGVLP